jgi:ABC-2 type transport system permease protein
LASTFTDNQIVAFIIAVFMSFILHSGFASLASIDVWGDFSFLISKLGIAYHYTAISKGLIDSRDVLYFLSVIAIMLSSSKLVLSSRNW